MSFHNEWAKIKRYAAPSRREWLEFLVVALVFGFAISFNDWGADTLEIGVGIRNLVGGTLLAALALAIHHGVQRLMALRYDVQVKHSIWWNGIILVLLLAILTNGKVLFLAATAMQIKQLKLHRLGHFRYHSFESTKSAIAISGPIANLITAAVFALLVTAKPALGTPMMIAFITINVVMTVLNMLPIPPLDGIHLFYRARTTYAAVFGGVVAGAVALALIESLTIMGLVLIIALGAGGCALIWHKVFE